MKKMLRNRISLPVLAGDDKFITTIGSVKKIVYVQFYVQRNDIEYYLFLFKKDIMSFVSTAARRTSIHQWSQAIAISRGSVSSMPMGNFRLMSTKPEIDDNGLLGKDNILPVSILIPLFRREAISVLDTSTQMYLI